MLRIRSNGTNHTIGQLGVQTTNGMTSIGHLMVKTGDEGIPPNTTPVYEHIASFVPPDVVPMTPSLNWWDPKDGPIPQEPPPGPTQVHVYVTPINIGVTNQWRKGWRQELQFNLNGKTSAPEQVRIAPLEDYYTFEWFIGVPGGQLRVRSRWVNEAGASDWSGFSNAIPVKPE